jgi:TolB-like protein
MAQRSIMTRPPSVAASRKHSSFQAKKSTAVKVRLYIETVPRTGYRFVAPVIRIESQAASSDAEDLHHTSLPNQPDRSVAVLYFENLSGAKEDEYFSDGMSEDVITELAKIRDLRVVPRSAVLAFRDKTPPVSQVGQQLGSAYVLQGSIRRADSRLRVTAQLAEARTGHSVWAERLRSADRGCLRYSG